MAREPSVLDAEQTNADSSRRGVSGGNTGLLDRRAYMRLAGVTTAAAAFSGVGAANGDDYEEITARGQVIRIGQGETYENKLFDLTNGNSVVLLVEGGGSVIRNIGFKGLHRGDGFMISITAPRGDVLIENVYLGDGSTKEGESFVHGPGAVFYHRDASCDVTFRHMNVQGWPNNGFYCSNTAHGGSVQFENCYGKNNGVSTYRVAGGNDSIVNCVAYNDNTNYGSGWGGYTEDSGRPVWVWNGGTVTIEDSNFASGSYPHAFVMHNGGAASMTGGGIDGNVHGSGLQQSDVSSSADLSMPSGVPTSAEAAAAGESSGSPDDSEDESDNESDHDLPNVVVFDGDGTTSATSYEFVVSDEVEPSTDEEATIDEGATVNGTHAEGTVADYRDAWRFDGEIERLTVDGDAAVRVNGEAVDPADFDDVLENVILIEGDESGATRYEFEVEGDVEKSNYEGASIDEEDVIEDSFVHGSVADWKDAFRFEGELEQLTVDGPGTVLVNDEPVDPDDYGTDLPHVLEVEGSGSPANFEITVDGEIELDSDDDPTDEATIISGSTVQSTVSDGTQTFNFAGAVTDVTITQGEATVSVNGEEIDPSEYGEYELLPHAIVIDGTEDDSASTYAFEVSGAVVKSDYRGASIDDEDVIEGKSVRGAVGNWLDAYWFEGDIEDFRLLGDASVDVQYNARDR
ncbi:hypothetical protein G6M89_19985 [Natronolimnobius sp. AArcel1]|uniref:hypothetical protein n=1 Tax=Natronolimnobius sp. AArcel1 TaxID=1679093 RepID=UPI0013EDB0CC|nr:hypothetical protein [Natronolimnobius sp. AArcel1]NGM71255.1 hypothetical protein [Natronolimnobius sp. AArcel1]